MTHVIYVVLLAQLWEGNKYIFYYWKTNAHQCFLSHILFYRG